MSGQRLYPDLPEPGQSPAPPSQMALTLSGKAALVTGAAQGLGRGFAEILLQHGAKVALLDVNETAGSELKARFDEQYGADSTLFLPCDVSSEEQLTDAFAKTFERFGRLDIVCNNAGIGNENDWEKTVAINLNAVIRGTYLALQYMRKENRGHGGVIVNVASMAGLGPMLTNPVYTGTKHGVVGFSRALADASQVCNYGVRINILCPGFVNTDLLQSLTPNVHLEDSDKLKEEYKNLIGVLGMMEVQEVAAGFLELVRDESRNGAVLKVNKRSGTSFHTFS
nr:PREDICTED: 15-hydroxyprostaglandin dehydrogenase [NAD(+)]-like isoform X2 [Lepisosteus oculatus]